MIGDNAENVTLPVANCVLCGWPMDGTVNILEVHIGTAVYRACADECPPAGVGRPQQHLAERRADADRVEREVSEVMTVLQKAGSPWADLECLTDLLQRHSRLQGLATPRRDHVDPSEAAGLSAAEVVKRVRERLRREDEET
jgi:hypothetical protein